MAAINPPILSSTFAISETITIIAAVTKILANMNNMNYIFTQLIGIWYWFRKFSRSSIFKQIVISFTNGCKYIFLYCFKSLSQKNFTLFFIPFIIQKGETAPGKTPKCWNNLSGEPKERRLELIISLRIFKSKLLSCSHVIK